MKAVALNFSYFLAAMAVLMFLSGVLSLGLGEPRYFGDFLIVAGLVGFFSGSIALALHGLDRRLLARERFILLGCLYLILPGFAALPLMSAVEELSFATAYFEAASALTTTGWSALPREEFLPIAVIVWRCLLQWFGGALALFAIIFVLAPSKVGGLPESVAGRYEHRPTAEGDRMALAVTDILPLYTLLTAVAYICLLATGVDGLQAFGLATASASTSSFTASATDLEGLPYATMVVVTLASMVAAVSVVWVRHLLTRRRAIRVQREAVALLFLVLGGGLAFGIYLSDVSGQPISDALIEGTAIVASISTTSGLEVRAGGVEVLPIAVLMTLALIGGASFSTAGGIKLFRIGAMAYQAFGELLRLIYPRSVQAMRYGSQLYDIQTMKAVWSAFIAFVATAMLAAALFGAAGLPLDQALLGGVGTVSNLALPLTIDASGTRYDFADLTDQMKILLAICLSLGRVEIIAGLALLLPEVWRR